MIYTIGTKNAYDASLTDPDQPPVKMGPDKKLKYNGGYAFENPLAAYDYIHQQKKKGFEVYGMKGVWAKDVYWNEKAGLHLTKRDLTLVKL